MKDCDIFSIWGLLVPNSFTEVETHCIHYNNLTHLVFQLMFLAAATGLELVRWGEIPKESRQDSKFDMTAKRKRTPVLRQKIVHYRPHLAFLSLRTQSLELGLSSRWNLSLEKSRLCWSATNELNPELLLTSVFVLEYHLFTILTFMKPKTGDCKTPEVYHLLWWHMKRKPVLAFVTTRNAPS